MKRTIPVALGALLAGLLLGASVGVIVASGTPQLHACVQSGGVMRYVSTAKCKTGEKLLTWNVQGPAGQPGPSGAPGAAGSGGTGTSTPPGAFYLTQGGGVGFNAGGASTVLTAKLPAGTYILQFSVPFTDADVDPASGNCWLTTDANGSTTGSLAIGSAVAGSNGGGSTAEGYASFAAATTVYARCSLTSGPPPDGAPINTSGAQLVATLATRLALPQ
jgi:hypothetical protein